MELRASLTRGASAGVRVLWELAKVIVPAVVIVNVLDKSGVLSHLNRLLAPVMGLFGVPGEGALVLVTGNLVSFYAGLAALVALTLTLKQKTILAVMMMMCHSTVSETALVAKAGARSSWVLLTRLAAAVLAGLMLNWLLP